MTRYSFVTVWRVYAPIEKVWEAAINSEQWPSWWKSVRSVETLEKGNTNEIGRLQRVTWKTPLLYSLTFDARVIRVEPKKLLEVESSGELEGKGTWNLRSEGAATIVRYDWNVRTTKAWMNAIAPIGGPFFEWNHNAVMKSGAIGLAKLLNTKVETLQA